MLNLLKLQKTYSKKKMLKYVSVITKYDKNIFKADKTGKLYKIHADMYHIYFNREVNEV